MSTDGNGPAPGTYAIVMFWSCLILTAEHAFVPVQWERATVRREGAAEVVLLGAVAAVVGAGALIFLSGMIEIGGITHCANWHRKHASIQSADGPLPPLSCAGPGSLLLAHLR